MEDEDNVQKAQELIQPAVKAIEQLIENGDTDWTVDGFELFQSMLDSDQSFITSEIAVSLAKWLTVIVGQGKGLDLLSFSILKKVERPLLKLIMRIQFDVPLVIFYLAYLQPNRNRFRKQT